MPITASSTTAAAELFAEALALDPDEPKARFFTGLALRRKASPPRRGALAASSRPRPTPLAAAARKRDCRLPEQTGAGAERRPDRRGERDERRRPPGDDPLAWSTGSKQRLKANPPISTAGGG